MARINVRNKGATAEREFIAILQRTINKALGEDGFVLTRNLEQTRDGGCDVAGAPPEYDFFAFEIKRQETLYLARWWKQTLDQTNKNQVPVLAYRQTRKPWLIITEAVLPYHHTPCRVEISLEDFLSWYDLLLKKRKACLLSKK